MNRKAIYITLILIIIVIIAIILINIKNNKVNIENNTIISNNQNENDLEEVYELSEGFDEADFKNFDLEIKGIPNTIIEKINNAEQFYYELKKYVYQNGLSELKIIEIENFKENKDEIKLKFKSKDSRDIKIIATISLKKNNTYEFIYY